MAPQASRETTLLLVTEGHGPHRFLGELVRGRHHRLIGRARSIDEALEMAPPRPPHVVVVEVLSGSRIAELSRCSALGTGLVVVSGLPPDVALLPSLAAGARAFVSGAGEDGLVDCAVAAVAAGSVFFDSPALAWLVEVAVARHVLRKEGALTLRQAQVMRLVGRGHTNREIALLLGISPETVKSHVHRVMRELGAHDRWTAAARTSPVRGSIS